MANIKKIKLNAFKFQPFSKKQMQLLIGGRKIPL